MKNRINLIILLIILLPALSGCFWEKKEPTGRQAPEVLIASDCGFDRLKCCATTPTCTYGQQCCVSPNDSSLNYCADNCNCGNNEEFCCAGNKCNGNAVCQNGVCVACGEMGQACCSSGKSCIDGLGCLNGECAECGVSNGPCCEGQIKCSTKENQKTECWNNVCTDCGFDGNKPCREGDVCLKGQLLLGKTCERCGGANQPCCAEGSSIGYICDPKQELSCQLGFCAKGVKNQQ